MTRRELMRGLVVVAVAALCVSVLVVSDRHRKTIQFEENSRFYIKNSSTYHQFIMQGQIELLDPADIEMAKYFIGQLKFRSYDDYLAGNIIGVPRGSIEIRTGDIVCFMDCMWPHLTLKGQWYVGIYNSKTGARIDEGKIYTMPDDINEQAIAFIESIKGKEIFVHPD